MRAGITTGIAMAHDVCARHGCQFVWTDKDACSVHSAAADLVLVLGDAPTYYQCIPQKLWKCTVRELKAHAAIATTFLSPCSYASWGAQQEVFEHLAWLWHIVLGVLMGDHDWEHAQNCRASMA